MAKRKLYLNGELTYAEKEILRFLESNKGTPYTNNELEEFTGIQVSYIDSIIRNLRLKGYEIITDRRKNKHEYKANGLASYLLSTLVIMVIIFIFIGAGLDYLDQPAAVYEVEKVIE